MIGDFVRGRRSLGVAQFGTAQVGASAARDRCDFVPWYCTYVPVIWSSSDCREALDVQAACRAGYFPEPPPARPPAGPTPAELRCGPGQSAGADCLTQEESSRRSMEESKRTWMAFFKSQPAAPLNDETDEINAGLWIGLILAGVAVGMWAGGSRR